MLASHKKLMCKKKRQPTPRPKAKEVPKIDRETERQKLSAVKEKLLKIRNKKK